MRRIWAPGLVVVIILSVLTFNMPGAKNFMNEREFVEATTDKYCYELGEQVVITLTNIVNETVFFSSGPYWIKIHDASGEIVYEKFPYADYVAGIAPGKSINHTWDQKNFTGVQVPLGNYAAWVGHEHGWVGDSIPPIYDGEIGDTAEFWIDDCPSALVADAGPDQTVNEGDTVFFNGTAYDPNGGAGKWFPKANIPIPRYGGGSTTLNGEIYYVGGDIPDCIPEGTTIFQKYNPATDSWSNLSDLPAPRVYLGATTAKGKIYAIGGNDGYASTDTVFEFDPITNNWTSKAPMPVPMEAFGIASVNDRIYVIGGFSTFIVCYPCGSVYEYDPSTNSWSTKPNMPTGRKDLATAVHEGKIYVIGGSAYGSVGAVEVYDPSTEVWARKTNMTIPRFGLSAQTLGGRIYAFGGIPTYGFPMNVTEIYNPSINNWTSAPSMLDERFLFGSGVSGNCMYAVAGGIGGLNPQIPNYTEEYCLGGNLTFEWDFDANVDLDGDGNYTNDKEETSPTPTHVYYDDGVYIVTLIVTDPQGLQDMDECNITVLNVPPTVELRVLPTDVNVSLRIAGEKWHNVSIELYEDNVLIAQGNLTRYPGSPNDQMLHLMHLKVNISRRYSTIVRYTPENDPINGQPNGANPCWIILEFNDGEKARLHHTFNVQHPEAYIWEVDLTTAILLYGLTFEAKAYDPGADDLTFHWDFGDGTNITNFHPNNNKTFPVEITETITHVYLGSGTFKVTLNVKDDDGGSDRVIVIIIIP